MRSLAGFLLFAFVVGVLSQCTTQANTKYSTNGDLVTLYNVASTGACCSACQTFEECTVWSYTASNKQCVVKSSLSSSTSSATGVTSGTYARSYTRPTACTQQDANTDYYTQNNLGSAPSSSGADCCAKCSAVTGCNYWTLSGGICWFKANLGNKVSSNGVISGTVIPASISSIAKRLGKRGLGLFGTESCSDLRLLTGISWAYNWAENPGILEECYLELGIQFVPMLWGLNAQYDVVYGKSPYLLTFNEPNFPEQSNMSPQQAANAWPKVQAVAAKYGMLIAAPSASYGGSNMDPIAWLDQFFSLCSGCKVDFINTHQYDCNYNSLYGAITNFYKYGKPVWVTEFSCWTGTTIQDKVTFVNGILPKFDNDPKIFKYSYFGARSAGGSLIDVWDSTSSALTSVGVAYNGPSAATSAPTTIPTSAPTARPTPAPTAVPTTKATPSPTTAPTTSPVILPSYGFLKSKLSGLFVTQNTGDQLVATASSVASATYFTFSTVTNGKSIKSNVNGKYVSAEDAGSSPLVANRLTISGWETFVSSSPQSGYFAFLAAANSKYVAVQSTNTLVATSATVSDATLFQVVAPIAPSGSINIDSSTNIKLFSKGAGAFISVDSNSYFVAGAGAASTATTFVVAKPSAGAYTLQNAATSKYACADNGGTNPIIVNRATASGWETFNFVAKSGGTYAITASANGMLVSTQGDGHFMPTVSNSGTIPDSALFYVIAA